MGQTVARAETATQASTEVQVGGTASQVGYPSHTLASDGPVERLGATSGGHWRRLQARCRRDLVRRARGLGEGEEGGREQEKEREEGS